MMKMIITVAFGMPLLLPLLAVWTGFKRKDRLFVISAVTTIIILALLLWAGSSIVTSSESYALDYELLRSALPVYALISVGGAALLHILLRWMRSSRE